MAEPVSVWRVKRGDEYCDTKDSLLRTGHGPVSTDRTLASCDVLHKHGSIALRLQDSSESPEPVQTIKTEKI